MMMNIRKLVFCLCLTAGLTRAAAAPPTPKFEEVFKVLSTNLGGVSAADLDRAAVQGLIAQLGPRVALVDGATRDPLGSPAAPVASWRVFDGSFAYVRVADVTGSLPAAFSSTYRQMAETNKIKGLVLDLRFAGGTNYEAAAKVADCFLNGEHPLLDWQSGNARSTKKTDAIQVPLAILVNSKTTGAAEALAAVLREENVGLILGSATAGQASLYKEFPLSNGEELRVAVASVSLSGGKALSQGVVPDIAIHASLEDQRAQQADPYLEAHLDMTATTNGSQAQFKPDDSLSTVVAKTAAATNGIPQPARRFNEAELVRQHKAGEDGQDNEIGGPPAPIVPVIADTVLSRALDLLKGLSIVQPNHPG
jgi:hypothetical protein